jgi:ABC-type antimicrobial peptide transport system permease subunit
MENKNMKYTLGQTLVIGLFGLFIGFSIGLMLGIGIGAEKFSPAPAAQCDPNQGKWVKPIHNYQIDVIDKHISVYSGDTWVGATNISKKCPLYKILNPK